MAFQVEPRAGLVRARARAAARRRPQGAAHRPHHGGDLPDAARRDRARRLPRARPPHVAHAAAQAVDRVEDVAAGDDVPGNCHKETPRRRGNAGAPRPLRLGVSCDEVARMSCLERTPVAIVGGGWAGCAAAVDARRRRRAGRRCSRRRPCWAGARGASSATACRSTTASTCCSAPTRETLALLARVHGDAAARALFVRRPLTIVPFAPRAARRADGRRAARAGTAGPPRSDCSRARGLSLARAHRQHRLVPPRSSATASRGRRARPSRSMLAPLPPRVARLPVGAAVHRRAQHAGRDGVGAGLRERAARSRSRGRRRRERLRAAGDTTSPRSSPRRPRAACAARGGAIRTRHAARRSWRPRATASPSPPTAHAERASAAIVAVGPHQLRQAFAAEALAAHPPLPAAIGVARRARVRADRHDLAGLRRDAWRCPAPIARLDDAPGQWVFDRPDVLARARARRPAAAAQLLAVVVSARGPHMALTAGRAGARRRRAAAAAAAGAAGMRRGRR